MIPASPAPLMTAFQPACSAAAKRTIPKARSDTRSGDGSYDPLRVAGGCPRCRVLRYRLVRAPLRMRRPVGARFGRNTCLRIAFVRPIAAEIVGQGLSRLLGLAG